MFSFLFVCLWFVVGVVVSPRSTQSTGPIALSQGVSKDIKPTVFLGYVFVCCGWLSLLLLYGQSMKYVIKGAEPRSELSFMFVCLFVCFVCLFVSCLFVCLSLSLFFLLWFVVVIIINCDGEVCNQPAVMCRSNCISSALHKEA